MRVTRLIDKTHKATTCKGYAIALKIKKINQSKKRDA